MADPALRPITEDELGAFVRAADLAFGFVPPASHVELERGVVEYDRTIVAEADGQMVGAAAAYSMDMTLPASPVDLGSGNDALTLPVAAVTNVGVRPTHHRRGVLTSMMAHQLADAAERGDAAAVLLASEAGIYRRFGYGVATEHESLRLDVHRSATLFEAPHRHLRLVPQGAAADLIAAVYDGERRRRPGQLSRSPAWWDCVLAETATWKSFGRGFVVVASEGEGGPTTGYALYRIHQRGEIGEWEAEVVEMASVDPGTDAALWHYLTTLDLIGSVRVSQAPVDEPHRLRLADPRALAVTQRRDGLWVRPLDLGSLLTRRGYAGEGTVAFAVQDPFGQWVDARSDEPAGSPRRFSVHGAHRLETRSDGAGLTLLGGSDPDLTLDVGDLGALSLGHTTWTSLVWAGRATEHRPGAAMRADELFSTHPAPFCATRF
jgi:predicted acetyltransferase